MHRLGTVLHLVQRLCSLACLFLTVFALESFHVQIYLRAMPVYPANHAIGSLLANQNFFLVFCVLFPLLGAFRWTALEDRT